MHPGDPRKVRQVQHDILDTYYRDFGKHGKSMVFRVRQVWDSIPAYYFSKDSSQLEIDSLVQYEGRVIPCEVKAETNVKGKSLSSFIKNDWPELQLKGLRVSMKPFIDQGWMENIPLYAVESYFQVREE